MPYDAYSNFNTLNPALFKQMYGYNPTDFNYTLGTTNVLDNAALAKEYAGQHPYKNMFAKLTGKSNGYSPLGNVTPSRGILDRAVDTGMDVAGEGIGAAAKAKSVAPLKGLFNKANYGWSKGSGLKAFGKNVGKAGNIASGVIQGIQAGVGIHNLDKKRDSLDDLTNDIMLSYASNPMAGISLTDEQKRLLRELDKGKYNEKTSFSNYLPNSVGDVLRPFIQSGIGLATGGVPGAIIGGVGGTVNEGLDNANEAQQQKIAELEALLSALQESEMQYKNMMRANAYNSFANSYGF